MKSDARHAALLSVPMMLLLAICGPPTGCSPDPGGNNDAGTGDSSMVDADDDVPDDDSSDSTSGPVEVGEACTSPGVCVDGAACVGDRIGDEFRCMLICDEAGRVCEDGSICTARLNSPPICYTLGEVPEGGACEYNLDCVAGSLCFGSSPEQYCIRACHPLDDVCEDGEFCDAQDGRGPCRSIVGSDCDVGADCLDDLVCTSEQPDPLGSAFPKGYCTSTGCSTDEECPYESVCRTPPGTTRAICMQPCVTESDCRFNQGYTCLGPTECTDTNDREACGAFLGNEKLCVPDGFTTQF